MRAAVEALLRSNDQAGAEFLETPAAALAEPGLGSAPTPGDLTPGATASPRQAPEHYELGGEIARGGMGNILEAEDRRLGRKVAMKVMRLDAAASGSARARIIREATVLARLDHPNIVPIHDLGRDEEGRLFYTMKLVHGRTLQAILGGLKERDPGVVRQYTLDRLLTIFRKICDALSLAHARGVVHRDLKPANVMVGEFGEVLVMDWGIAKILDDANQATEEGARMAEPLAPSLSPSDEETAPAGRVRGPDVALPAGFQDLDEAFRPAEEAALTMDGTVMGTPHYMSPEQADGRINNIDAQSDVFSLGAILYALLTLHPPVEAASTQEVIELIKRGEIRPPTEYNVTTKAGLRRQSRAGAAADPQRFRPLPHCPGGKVPAALSAVTMRALSVDKAQRYPTVAAFAADIEAYQGGFATLAENANGLKQFQLLLLRHKVVTTALAVLLLLSVGFVWKVKPSERQATLNAERATQNEQKALAETEAARRELARAQIALADSAFRNSDPVAMVRALDSVPEDLRDQRWD